MNRAVAPSPRVTSAGVASTGARKNPALPPAQEREFSIAAGDNGSIWTGNSSLSLTHIAADGAITSFPRTRETIAVRRDHNGTIWSAGAGDFHLWKSSGKGFSPLHYPEEELDAVVSVAVDRHNDPWITTRSDRAYRLVVPRFPRSTSTNWMAFPASREKR